MNKCKLTEKQEQKLKENWDIRETLEYKIPVRIYARNTTFQIYLLAMDPEDTDIVYAIVDGFELEIEIKSLEDILSLHNQNGEYVQVDERYIPRMAKDTWKYLNKRRGYEF